MAAGVTVRLFPRDLKPPMAELLLSARIFSPCKRGFCLAVADEPYPLFSVKEVPGRGPAGQGKHHGLDLTRRGAFFSAPAFRPIQGVGWTLCFQATNARCGSYVICPAELESSCPLEIRRPAPGGQSRVWRARRRGASAHEKKISEICRSQGIIKALVCPGITSRGDRSPGPSLGPVKNAHRRAADLR